ncbi:hypothetical protein ACFUGD_02810 [Streptomyces sp. NPDC057217]|uniref:hypothetical protein n=1 Tax=Streptomyces sp. NPDC057217 TaxID=3346054 RepID=UPI003640F756
MNITVPTNIPSGDRRPVRVVPLATLDPLHDSSRRPLPAPPLDIAVRVARTTLAYYEYASIHDHTAMIAAATALDVVLRDLLAALDADRTERAA